MNPKSTTATQEREVRQLHRLEFLMDVIFALIIWRIFSRLPTPESFELSSEAFTQFIIASSAELEIILVGIVLVIIYWLQNNMLFGNLRKTDTRHTAISILQIFSLLLFLYANRLGIVFQGNTGSLLLQSISLVVVGLLAVWAWHHAITNRLLISDSLSEEDAGTAMSKISGETIGAAITIPFALVGPGVWTLSWLIYPLGRWILKRPR
jgi:uncharacterized membrane protein